MNDIDNITIRSEAAKVGINWHHNLGGGYVFSPDEIRVLMARLSKAAAEAERLATHIPSCVAGSRRTVTVYHHGACTASLSLENGDRAGDVIDLDRAGVERLVAKLQSTLSINAKEGIA